MAITNGVLAEPGEFPAVRMIKSYNTTCTGALIGDRLLLTARHCVFNNVQKPRPPQFISVEDSPVQDFYFVASSECVKDSAYQDPDFTNDVAVVKLKNSAQEVFNIDATSFLQISAKAAFLGQDIRLVGYGKTVAYKNSVWENNEDLQLRTGINRILELVEGFAVIYGYSEPATQRGVSTGISSNVFEGDSGSPLLDEETGLILGVASYIEDKSKSPIQLREHFRNPSHNRRHRSYFNLLFQEKYQLLLEEVDKCEALGDCNNLGQLQRDSQGGTNYIYSQSAYSKTCN